MNKIRTSYVLALLLIAALLVATLTLWLPAYWPVAAFEIAIFVIAAIALIQRMRPAREKQYPIFVLSFVACWGCLQLITRTTINRFATERSIMQWITWAALYYAAVALLTERARIRPMLKIMVWFGFALSLEAILQTYLTPGNVYGLFPSGYNEFVMGPIIYHTHFAVLVETVLPIALFMALGEGAPSFVMLTISAVMFTSLVVCASRGGLIIASGESLGVVVLLHRRVPNRNFGSTALTLGAATAALVAIVGWQTASARFYNESLLAGRLQFARATLHMIAARPWAGWGLGCWQSAYPVFAAFDPGVIVNQAHTDWLQWTAEGGLPVGIAMFSMFLWLIRPALRSVWGIGVIAVFAHAAFDYPFSRPAIGAWPILLLAMAVATRR